MHDVQIVLPCHFVHADRESQGVWWVLEQRVVRDFDFVEEQPLVERREAKRLCVGDEVDLVTAGRQLDAELSGQRAGPAVRPIRS
jgi:hypothetical protein